MKCSKYQLSIPKRLQRWSLAATLGLLLLGLSTYSAQAQDGRIRWKEKFNISNTATTSTEPLIVSDPSGYAYLFWSEDIEGERFRFTGSGNTLFCVMWDGSEWSQPIDVMISPKRGGVLGHRAIVDASGTVHMIWFGDNPAKVFYSQAPAFEGCQNATSWSTPVELATEISATENSVALAYEAPYTLHVIYARGPQGAEPEEPRGVTYIKSTDSGLNWSQSLDLYVTPDPRRGASNLQLNLLNDHALFATWTEWDATGNGQHIFFTQSADSGLAWGIPQEVAATTSLEYEHDWLSMVALPETERIAAIWEGGERAYRQMRFSDDDGETWSPRRRLFEELVGENGYTEFVYDAVGRLHLFLANRGISGRFEPSDIGLYHSVWEGNRWRPPELLQGINPMVNPKVAILGGDQFVAAWYSSTNDPLANKDRENTFASGDIIVMTGTIDDTPRLASVDLPSPTPRPTVTATPTIVHLTATPTSTRQPVSFDLNRPNADLTPNPGLPLFAGMVSATFMIFGCVAIYRLRQRVVH